MIVTEQGMRQGEALGSSAWGRMHGNVHSAMQNAIEQQLLAIGADKDHVRCASRRQTKVLFDVVGMGTMLKVERYLAVGTCSCEGGTTCSDMQCWSRLWMRNTDQPH